MKKIVIAASIAMVMASSIMASGYIKGGVAQSTAKSGTNPTATAYEIGYGGTGHLKSTGNLLLGGEVNFGMQTFDLAGGTENDMKTIGGSFLVGWTFFNDLDVYGTIGYYGTSMDYTFSDGSSDTLTGGGVRYGAGLDYTFWKHMSIGAEYTTTNYNLSSVYYGGSGDVKITNIGGNLKFRF